MHTLRELPPDLNPLVRINQLGAQALSNHELVAILLGEAPNGDNPVVIAERLIAQYGGMAQLARLPMIEPMNQKGIGIGRARRLAAAFELAKRIGVPDSERFQIRSPADLYSLMSDMQYLEQEQLRVALLNTKNRVIKVVTVYQGSVHTNVIRVAELFRDAVRWNATAIALAHNHPSGADASPSPEDVSITREVVKAGALMDIDVIEHLVLGHGCFVSMRERGLGF
ncbi:MAG: DNA repair protein RadC [Chloroflexi bacterium]|nr:DNA repair protein RadC [Chloroflexota bacterium]